MSRKKLSEYRAKTIIAAALGNTYTGWSVASANIGTLDIGGYDSCVVKVDQGIKGRFKKGLVLLDVKKDGLVAAVKKLEAEGFQHFLIEPYVVHDRSQERYISIAYDRSGYVISCSSSGGIDIEANPGSIENFHITDNFHWEKLALATQISETKLRAVLRAFKDNYFVFLEINPYVATENTFAVLDAAVEVDDAGMHFAKNWKGSDVRESGKLLTKQEKIVRALDEGSAASFNLSVINPNGSIFLLLSGGGASIVVADEVYNKGFGARLANYGEYSGNPDLHETYKYTTQLIELILNSSAPEKVLFIGGAVANFTDIATTFAGIIKAIDEHAEQLARQNLTIYVRRGGPNQETGLKNITLCLEKHGLLGGVYDPLVTISDALGSALEGFGK